MSDDAEKYWFEDEPETYWIGSKPKETDKEAERLAAIANSMRAKSAHAGAVSSPFSKAPEVERIAKKYLGG